MDTRRSFLKKAGITTAGVALGGMTARSYASVAGANDRLNFALVGINGRGNALLASIASTTNARISHICDVDSRVITAATAKVSEVFGAAPKAFEDFRKLLEDKTIDAVAIATPEHWHAPMTIMAAQAGKHVYIEKPCSHNPHEGELLNLVKQKTGKIIQMGNQQRSAPTSIMAIKEIREGIIGNVYFGKAWYSNGRGPIGTGKVIPVPDWLNWELWQGPAPRREFKDNLVHYNWHWFWHYGTGEINNNGTHEIDICRWALGVDIPLRVDSAGGRFHFQDDWEFADTQVTNFQFSDNKMISWEGRSCNPFKINDLDRGASIHGTKGTIVLDRNNYRLFDLGGKLVKHEKEAELSATTNTVGAGSLDVYHMQNFADAIRLGAKQNSPIQEGVTSNLLCHLGNISQKMGRSLNIDPATGRILNDAEAMKLWQREYQPGWEPKV